MGEFSIYYYSDFCLLEYDIRTRVYNGVFTYCRRYRSGAKPIDNIYGVVLCHDCRVHYTITLLPDIK